MYRFCVAKISVRKSALTFEHVTEKFLHGCVTDGATEEEGGHPVRGDVS